MFGPNNVLIKSVSLEAQDESSIKCEIHRHLLLIGDFS